MGWRGDCRGVAFAHSGRDTGVCVCTATDSRKSLQAKCPRAAWAGAGGRALTLGLARGRGLLGAGMLDEHVVLVVGAALLAHLHHLHLRQRCVPLHHVLGPQGHQAADLQLAPARDRGHGPGEPAAPAPGSAQSRSPARPFSQAPGSPAQPRGPAEQVERAAGRGASVGTQASPRGARPPRASSPYLWLAGLRKKTRRVIIVAERFLQALRLPAGRPPGWAT